MIPESEATDLSPILKNALKGTNIKITKRGKLYFARKVNDDTTICGGSVNPHYIFQQAKIKLGKQRGIK